MIQRVSIFVVLFALLALAACGSPAPQTSAFSSPVRIAVIASGQSRLPKLDGLRKGLHARGYVEGRDYTVSLYNAKNDRARVQSLIQQALQTSPDLLVTLGGVETNTAKHLRSPDGPPIVFIGVADTVHWGIIDSFQRPGYDITGVDNQYVELTGKRLEFLSMFDPTARNLLLLYSQHIIPSVAAKQEAERAAAVLDLSITSYSIDQVNDLERVFDLPFISSIDAIIIVPSFILENAAPTTLFPAALTHGIPVIGLNDDATAKGAFLSYGASFFDMGYQAARLVDKVLRGNSPHYIPVEYPDIPSLTVNREAAMRCKINLTEDLLPLVDQFFP